MQNGEQLFWALADDLLNRPGITRSTMMGNPCLRCDGAFFACVESKTGRLIVKLPGARVLLLVSSGRAVPFVPNGRAFREWAAFPAPRRKEWAAILDEAQRFVSPSSSLYEPDERPSLGRV